MKDPLKTIESLGSIKLSEQEKAQMFSHIQNHIDESLKSPLPSPYTSFNVWSFIQRHSVYATAAALFLVLAGGSAAAESSLPGDILYSVKRNVNEKVMEVLALNDDAQASVKIKLVERRFEEAEKILAATPEDEATLAALAADIQSHTTEAITHIQEIEQSKSVIAAAELSNDLSTTINTHDAYIDSITAPEEAPIETMSLSIAADARSLPAEAPMNKQSIQAMDASSTPTLQSIIDETRNQVDVTTSDLTLKIITAEEPLVTEDDLADNKKELEDILDNPELSEAAKAEVQTIVDIAEQNQSENDFNNAFIMLEEAEKLAEGHIKKEIIENEAEEASEK